MTLALAAALVPFLAALLSALLPRGPRQHRRRGAVAIGGAALALLLALLLAVRGAPGGPWLGAAGALFVVLLAYTLALAAAIGAVRPTGTAGLRDAGLQAAPGAVALAALAGDPATGWAASALALLLLTLPASHRPVREQIAARRRLLVGAACLVVALAGAVLFDAAADDPALRQAGGLLLLIGYVGLGLLVPAIGDEAEASDDGLAAGGLTAFAIAVPLRLQAGAALPGGLLAPAGLACLLAGAIAAWLRPAEPPHRCAVPALCGASLVGLGLGSELGRIAGLLLLASTLLAGAACRLADSAPQRPGARLANPTLGLLPPFGPFAGAALLLAETVLRAPLYALPLALGLAAVALPLGRRRHAPGRLETPGDVATGWTVLGLLALCLAIGIALPPSLAQWLARAVVPPG